MVIRHEPLAESKLHAYNLFLQIMKTLAVLPISTKNMLEESKVLTLIQRWAQIKTLPQQAEMDGYSSENTSRAQTPLNTPDGSSAKMAPELDGDTSKPAVYRRLKIISENSLDSALSDASKASDGKEDEDEEEEAENHNADPHDGASLKEEHLSEGVEPTKESVEGFGKELRQDESETSSSSQQQQPQDVDMKDETELDSKIKETKEGPTNEAETPNVLCEAQASAENPECEKVPEKVESEELSSIKVEEPESQSNQTVPVDVLTEQPPETKETRKEAEEEVSTEPQLGESAAEAPPNSETPEAPVPAEGTLVQVEPSVIGTPSQDEEEGVSDVESERSQEPHLSVLDISGMAARLLESWKDLKVSEDRIPFTSRAGQLCVNV